MDSAPISKSNFIIEKNVGFDESMLELSKMCILFAIEEFRDDDWKKSNFVCQKFEGKYGGRWCSCFIKNGDVRFIYDDKYLKLKYKDYLIKIANTY